MGRERTSKSRSRGDRWTDQDRQECTNACQPATATQYGLHPRTLHDEVSSVTTASSHALLTTALNGPNNCSPVCALAQVPEQNFARPKDTAQARPPKKQGARQRPNRSSAEEVRIRLRAAHFREEVPDTSRRGTLCPPQSVSWAFLHRRFERSETIDDRRAGPQGFRLEPALQIRVATWPSFARPFGLKGGLSSISVSGGVPTCTQAPAGTSHFLLRCLRVI